MAVRYEDFNTKTLETFYRFIHERHNIWHRRFVEKLPAPWTTSQILQRNKFTNIYRELDPGTEFVRRNIIETDYPRWDRVFNVMIYRLICKIPTYQHLGFQELRTFDIGDMLDKFEEIDQSDETVFGNAYLISPYSSMGSPIKYVNVARLFLNIRANGEAFFTELDLAPSFERMFKVINSQYGFGPFLAYQVCVDLLYPDRRGPDYRPMYPYSHDDWAKLGPGAKRGLARIINVSGDAWELEALRWLHRNQELMFDQYKLRFPWLRDNDNKPIRISLSNLQNCCCEFSKYVNITHGTGKAQRLFVPRESYAV